MTFLESFWVLLKPCLTTRFFWISTALVFVVLLGGVLLLEPLAAKLLWTVALVAVWIGALTQYSLQVWSLKAFPELKKPSDHGHDEVMRRAAAADQARSLYRLNKWASRVFFLSVLTLLFWQLLSRALL